MDEPLQLTVLVHLHGRPQRERKVILAALNDRIEKFLGGLPVHACYACDPKWKGKTWSETLMVEATAIDFDRREEPGGRTL